MDFDLFNLPPFKNTIALSGNDLEKANCEARKGNAKVLEVFINNPDTILTPREVHGILEKQGFHYELTSVRRAITDLTSGAILEKMPKELQKQESKGKPNFTWKLKNVA